MSTFLLLRYLHTQQRERIGNGGFTLVELLVVVVIIGILAAIALPSFLAQSAKAKQSEAQVTLNAWIKAQQLYRYEYGRFFTFTDLALGMPTDTKTYNYVGGGGVENVDQNFVTLTPFTKDSALKRYSAGVEWDVLEVTLPNGLVERQSTDAPVLCESIAPSSGISVAPNVNGAGDGVWPTCPGGYVNIFRPGN
ncbi:prepilin-type N-terminal cleavage/methylation domain-containing protein [Gloeomargaritales cyanobacterium VI4D9]|nr:prepilin-type N-terminal cleavage/methylation domain-containing protein [Gloeomargaritales cyanobacterium VI4D9]